MNILFFITTISLSIHATSLEKKVEGLEAMFNVNYSVKKTVDLVKDVLKEANGLVKITNKNKVKIEEIKNDINK